MATDLHVVVVNQEDRRLGRQVVHDPASRRFALPVTVDREGWRTSSIRVFDPTPNPDQCHGECTFVSKANQGNAVGNRKRGRVFGMEIVHKGYGLATTLDPWQGSFPPDDTGSSGLAAAKAAQILGIGGEYRWLFGGVDEVVQAQQDGEAVSVGAWWTEGMFRRDARGVVEPTGRRVGGHQWTVIRYDKRRDLVGGLCWWGGFRHFWIKREHLGDLLADDGDAHVQRFLV